MKNLPTLSVVLSFFNEENNLLELIKRLKKSIEPLIKAEKLQNYELIFVNDNSTDRSEEIIRESIKDGNIVLINMTRNFGTSECVIAGFRQSKGDAIIYMDSDLQDPPELIPELVDKWLSESDIEVVYTTRLKRHGESWFKLFLIKYGYRVINKISDIELAVDSGDFKLISRKALDQLLQLNEAHPYLRGLVAWIGYKQVPVYYEREPRYDGQENTKVKILSKKNLSYWLDRALISFSDVPLKFILALGLLMASIIPFLIVYILALKINGYSVPGWAAIMFVISFFGGVQFLMLGIIGLYVGAIFRQSKSRPLYLIKEIIDNQSGKKL